MRSNVTRTRAYGRASRLPRFHAPCWLLRSIRCSNLVRRISCAGCTIDNRHGPGWRHRTPVQERAAWSRCYRQGSKVTRTQNLTRPSIIAEGSLCRLESRAWKADGRGSRQHRGGRRQGQESLTAFSRTDRTAQDYGIHAGHPAGR